MKKYLSIIIAVLIVIFGFVYYGQARVYNPSSVDTTGFLQSANDLSDVSSSSTARTNLGLGDIATFSSSTFAQVANNLSDLASSTIAISNLGLGTIATQNANSVAITGGTATIGTTTFSGQAGFSSMYTNATSSSATTTIDWNNRNFQTLAMGSSTSLQFTNPTNPMTCVLILKQGTTATSSITSWDTDIKWVGGASSTLSTATGTTDILSCLFDSTNYYCQLGKNWY